MVWGATMGEKKQREGVRMKERYTVKELTKMAMMATITFIGIYAVKIPSLHGYSHLGDCMIFISVMLLGTKKGALAGAVGAALSDLIGGWMQWILPTFFIKYIMALIMGLFIDKLMPGKRGNWFIGSVVGGAVQILLYTLVKVGVYGPGYAVAGVPGLTTQTITGIVLGAVFVVLFEKANVLQKLREM